MRKSRHREIADELMRDIASERYGVGSVLPSEAELQERFGVGRHTIREALRTLKEQGVLERRRRLGSIVRATQPIGQYVNMLLDERGLQDFVGHTDFTLTHEGYVHLSSALAERMGVEVGSRWLRIAGTRTLKDDDGFLCWSEIFLPSQLNIDRNEIRAPGRPIYEKVLNSNMLKLSHVEQEISATSMPASLSDLAGSEPNRPALMVKRRYFAMDGSIVEISFNLYPGDRYLARSIIRPVAR